MLKELCSITGVTGYEKNISKAIFEMLKNENLDEIYIDEVGNVICVKKGINNEKILISAHMDEVGFQVIKKLSDNEYSIRCLGGIRTLNAFGKKVICGNSIGIINAKNEDNLKPYNYDNMVLTIYSDDTIKTGDVFTFYSEFIETDNYYISKALDNRVSCDILIDLIRKNIHSECTLCYAFTVQEEMTMRGIRKIKTAFKPDICITLDTSSICDMNSVSLNDGVAITMSNALGVSSENLVNEVIQIATKNNINYQLEVSDCGTNEMIISNELDAGSDDLGLSIPIKEIHTDHSVVSKKDIENCKLLLEKIIEKI